MMKARLRKGFTLIELLVVVSIIALLVSILLPALGAARDAAKTVICSANLHNYGLALPMYAYDNDEWAPYAWTWLYSQESIDADFRECYKHCRWHFRTRSDGSEVVPDGTLWPYLKDKEVHMCPTFETYARRGGCQSGGHLSVTRFEPAYSYSMNLHLGFSAQGYTSSEAQQRVVSKEIAMKVGRVESPNRVFSFAEENPNWAVDYRAGDVAKYSANWLNDNVLWLHANKNTPLGAVDNFATYHGARGSDANEGKANVVFVDGHVELTRGLAGREAYETYGQPYSSHDDGPMW